MVYETKNNPTKQYAKKLITTLIILLVLATTAQATTIIKEFSTDKYRYMQGTPITISGNITNETTALPNTTVNITLRNQSGEISNTSTTTQTNGIFTTTITAPGTSGKYQIQATTTDLASPTINISVHGTDSIQNTKTAFTQGTVYTASLSTSDNIITSDQLDITNMGKGSQTINGTLYYFLATSSGTVYLDNDNNFNTTTQDTDGLNTIGNLQERSKIKLAGTTYTLSYVNSESQIVLQKEVQPAFTGSEGNRNLTILVLNSTNHPLSNKNLTIIVKNSEGSQLQSQTTASTNSAGLTTANITIPSSSGIYNVGIIESNDTLNYFTFSVNTYDMHATVLSTELDPQNNFAPGTTAVLAVYLKNLTTGTSINNTQASITAQINGPNNYNTQKTITYDTNNSMFKTTYTIPPTQGDYRIEYTATIGNHEQKAYSGFNVKTYNLYMRTLTTNMKFAEVEGFSPGEQAYMLISGFDLSNGGSINLHSLTASNKNNFTFNITNSTGHDVTSDWNVQPVTSFLTQHPIGDILETGEQNGSVINFTAPLQDGIYTLTATVNLNGTTETITTSIGVQSIFVYAMPVTSDGDFSPVASYQDNITLRINVFNPKTMQEETNITQANIIEVFSENAGGIVTEKMENIALVDKDGWKALTFYNNDSNLGFHFIKFWVNVTTTDGPKQAIGAGFFDTKQYYIWAEPESMNGQPKSFTSNSNITLKVTVENTGHSPQEGKTVSIDEIRHGRTWEKINFDTNSNSNWTGTTNANGTVNLSFTPSTPLKSGWYDVKIKLQTEDTTGTTVYDYGHGWFDVRNFMFNIWPESWDVKAGENINFTAQAIDPANPENNITASITLSKILHRTDWRQPPTEITGPHTLSDSTITTSATTQDTITYTGGAATSSGTYEFIFQAEYNGMIEERSTMIESQPFVAWWELAGNKWETRFGIGSEANILVKASDHFGGDLITLDANNTNITKVNKMGTFTGSTYKTNSELNVSAKQEGNTVNLTLNLTGWDEGEYELTIKAVDTNNAEVLTHMWIQVELASVGLPEFYEVKIPEGNVFTNRVSFNLTDTPSQIETWDTECNGYDPEKYCNLNYSAASNSKTGKNISFLKGDWQTQQQQTPFWAMVNLTEPRTLYVNYNDANFSDTTNTTIYSEDSTFEERNNNNTTIRRWNITSIGSDGTINMEGIDSLATGYKINPSISKSGSFIIFDGFTDNDWFKIDLNGDGSYQPDWFSRTGMYYIILADNTTSGTYDRVFVSNTTNFTQNMINASANLPIGFNGAPIYLIDTSYQDGMYNLKFTSYKMGWAGSYLGTFEKGKTIKIPFLVQSPGTQTGIPGASVEISNLYKHGPRPPLTVSSNGTTDAYGLALVELNTSGIPTGEYLLGYKVTLPAEYNNKEVSPTEKWRMPMFELRKFRVNGEIGKVGTITANKIYDGAGIHVLYGREIETRGATFGYPAGNPALGIVRVGWPFDMENTYYYKNDNYYTQLNETWDVDPASQVNSSAINLTMEGANTTYNFTDYIQAGENHTLNAGVTETFWQYWNITTGNILPEQQQVELIIDYLLDDETPSENRPPFSNGSEIYWGPGQLDIRITAIGNNAVYFELMQDKFLYTTSGLDNLTDGSPENGELDNSRVTRADYKGYTLYAYNDINQTSQESQGWGTPIYDRVYIVETGNTYRIGQPIPELDNDSVVMAAKWGGKIIINNATTGPGIYPLSEWAPDGDVYYVAEFTESDVNADLNNDWQIDTNTTYYLLLSDENPNGKYQATRGVFDDDKDLTQAWGPQGPMDFYGAEGGNVAIFGQSFDERHLELGTVRGWPIAVPSITYNEIAETATLRTLKPTWEPFDISENVSIFITARTFSNEPVTGTITVDQLIKIFSFGGDDDTETTTTEFKPSNEGFEQPTIYQLNTTANIVDGISVFEVEGQTLQNLTGGFDTANFVIRLNVTDNNGDYEIVERGFMVQNKTAFDKPIMDFSDGPEPESPP